MKYECVNHGLIDEQAVKSIGKALPGDDVVGLCKDCLCLVFPAPTPDELGETCIGCGDVFLMKQLHKVPDNTTGVDFYLCSTCLEVWNADRSQ